MSLANHPTVAEIAAEARAVQVELEALWADEGVDQLQIFLDPGIVEVLAQIKTVSMTFIRQVAAAV